MKRFALVVFISTALLGCSKPEYPNGIDLNVVQTVEYYRANLDTAKVVNAWCKQHLATSEDLAKTNDKNAFTNCQNASFALFSPKASVKKDRKYKSYD